jgi:hypothetical protein
MNAITANGRPANNVPRYCNRQVDAAMDAFSRRSSFRERQPYANFLQAQLQRDVPSTVLSIPYDLLAYNSKLRGLRIDSIAPFDDFMKVDI